jgi:hypothetical protein
MVGLTKTAAIENRSTTGRLWALGSGFSNDQMKASQGRREPDRDRSNTLV